ncbi:hypothetical protein LXA43DRAFT_1064584 [Ganoderma leucocontextum]|nr:hypothetical protein LXA43DRAFT_1064584 [Ganoderma leucocontextum]
MGRANRFAAVRRVPSLNAWPLRIHPQPMALCSKKAPAEMWLYIWKLVGEDIEEGSSRWTPVLGMPKPLDVFEHRWPDKGEKKRLWPKVVWASLFEMALEVFGPDIYENVCLVSEDGVEAFLAGAMKVVNGQGAAIGRARWVTHIDLVLSDLMTDSIDWTSTQQAWAAFTNLKTLTIAYHVYEVAPLGRYLPIASHLPQSLELLRLRPWGEYSIESGEDSFWEQEIWSEHVHAFQNVPEMHVHAAVYVVWPPYSERDAREVFEEWTSAVDGGRLHNISVTLFPPEEGADVDRCLEELDSSVEDAKKYGYLPHSATDVDEHAGLGNILAYNWKSTGDNVWQVDMDGMRAREWGQDYGEFSYQGVEELDGDLECPLKDGPVVRRRFLLDFRPSAMNNPNLRAFDELVYCYMWPGYPWDANQVERMMHKFAALLYEHGCVDSFPDYQFQTLHSLVAKAVEQDKVPAWCLRSMVVDYSIDSRTARANRLAKLLLVAKADLEDGAARVRELEKETALAEGVRQWVIASGTHDRNLPLSVTSQSSSPVHSVTPGSGDRTSTQQSYASPKYIMRFMPSDNDSEDIVPSDNEDIVPSDHEDIDSRGDIRAHGERGDAGGNAGGGTFDWPEARLAPRTSVSEVTYRTAAGGEGQARGASAREGTESKSFANFLENIREQHTATLSDELLSRGERMRLEAIETYHTGQHFGAFQSAYIKPLDTTAVKSNVAKPQGLTAAGPAPTVE